MDEFLFLFTDQDQSEKKDNRSNNRKRSIQLEPAPLNSFQLVETINGLCELHCRLEGLLQSSAKNGLSVPELLPTLAAFEAATKAALPAEIPDLVAHWAAKRTEALAKYSELVKKLVAASQLGDPGLFGVMQPEKLKIPEKMEPFMVFPEEEEEETKRKCSKEPKPLYAYCDQLEELFSCIASLSSTETTENSALSSNAAN